jgi:hypothetical protein
MSNLHRLAFVRQNDLHILYILFVFRDRMMYTFRSNYLLNLFVFHDLHIYVKLFVFHILVRQNDLHILEQFLSSGATICFCSICLFFTHLTELSTHLGETICLICLFFIYWSDRMICTFWSNFHRLEQLFLFIVGATIVFAQSVYFSHI